MLFLLAAAVPVWPQTVESPKNPGVYVVKKGDCLWNISQRVWGDPLKWPLLFATNEGKIRNPNLIYPGQKFTIPTTITKEELRKATQLAQERAVPLPARVTGEEGRTLKTHKKPEVATASNESGTTSVSKLSPPNTAPSANENKENAVNPTNEGAGSTAPTEGSSKIAILIVALLAFGGGLFLWFRKRSGGTSQQPRPLSSFPQAAQPPVNKPVMNPPASQGQTPSAYPPVSTPVAPVTPPPAKTEAASAPSQQGVSTPKTPVTPSTTSQNPSTVSTAKTGEFTGTITSISMSQPPVPSKAEPSNPAPSSTSTPPTPSASEDKTTDHPSNPPTTNP